MPHRSQDIWLNTLTKGDADKYKDIDGMYVILPDVLYRKIINHLKDSLLSVGNVLAKATIMPHSSDQLNYHCCHFDTEAASVCLQFWTFGLLCKICDEFKCKSVEVLRQYHSITSVNYFPVCENYISHVNIIREESWEVFQSQTKRWILKCIKEPSQFDYLKLWEQSTIAMLVQFLRDCLNDQLRLISQDQPSTPIEILSTGAVAWLGICDHVAHYPLRSCFEFFDKCLPKLLKQNENLNSIISTVSIFVTIALALISSNSSTPPVFPQMYARALSVYESLITKKDSGDAILQSCITPRNIVSKKDSLKLLQKALDQVIHSLLCNPAVNECENLLRYSLILTLTLFTNYIMIQPDSQNIPKIHSALKTHLNLSLDTARPFNFDYHAVRTSINWAKGTSDLFKVMEYLLCPSLLPTASRHEALSACVRRQDRLNIITLGDKDVRKLPSTSILGSQKKKGTAPLAIVPLIPEGERMKKLYFRLNYFQGEFPKTLKTISCAHGPPWMNLSESITNVTDSELLDVASSQTHFEAQCTDSSSVCPVCKVRVSISEDHRKSDNHKGNMRCFREFSDLHDNEYTPYQNKLLAVLTTTKVDQSEEKDFLKNNGVMICAIYEQREWEKGIILLQTKCIPKIKQILHKLSM